jgi:putative sterol carrier protein
MSCGVVARAVRRSGPRVARIDQRRFGHAALTRAIEHMLPRLFDPGAAGDLDATFELQLTRWRRAGPDRFTIAVRDGRLSVTRGAAPAPGAIISLGADDMVLLASGEVGWTELLATGRLTLSGDPFLALRFPRLFDLPPEPGDPLILRLRR